MEASTVILIMERVFATIPDVLGTLETNETARAALVLATWRKVAGEMLSARTEPLEYIDHRLIVAVRDTTWKRHLEDLAPQMIAKLNSRLGEGTVRFIEFRTGSSRLKAVKASANTSVDSTDLTPSVSEAANSIADPALRRRFVEAAAAYLASEK